MPLLTKRAAIEPHMHFEESVQNTIADERPVASHGCSRDIQGPVISAHTNELAEEFKKRKSLPEFAALARISSHQRQQIAQRVVSALQMRRLYQLLQRLDRERRHAAIVQLFSQEQRMAFEKWIREQHPSLKKEHRAAPSSKELECKGAELPSHRKIAKKSVARRRLSSTITKDNHVSGKSEPTLPGQVSQSSLRGVCEHRRRRGTFYSAMVLCERLELRTRELADYDTAVAYHAVLRSIRENLLARMQTTANVEMGDGVDGLKSVHHAITIEDHIPDIIMQVCADHKLDHEKDLGLYMRVNTPARPWIGASLCGPVFRLGKGLQAGLQGWKLMLTACRISCKSGESPVSSWELLRQAHLACWALTGRDDRSLACHLDELHRKHSQKRQESRQSAQLKKQVICNKAPPVTPATTKQGDHDVSQKISVEKSEKQVRRIVLQWTKRIEVAACRILKSTSRRKRARTSPEGDLKLKEDAGYGVTWSATLGG